MDVARYTTATAKRLPGVVSASSLAKKKRVVVTVDVVNAEDPVRTVIEQELADAVAQVFGQDLNVRVVLRDAGAQDGMLSPSTGAPAADTQNLKGGSA